MPEFIKGMQLSEAFFREVVEPVIAARFPALRYAAGLLGPGSETLGFDTARSTDHDWGPRVTLFLQQEDSGMANDILAACAESLPPVFRGHHTHFEQHESGTMVPTKALPDQPIQHRVEAVTVASFFRDYLDAAPDEPTTTADWLGFSEQKLVTIRSGEIFHDRIGLGETRKRFDYYPRDVWLYLLAAEWRKIAREDSFIGRCGETGDELGARLIAARLARAVMKLCFLMEQQYAPYSKWFGTAFAGLRCASELTPSLEGLLAAGDWRERQKHLVEACEFVAAMHNALGLTDPLPAKVSRFHDRPYLVIHAERFADELAKLITDSEVLHRIAND